MTDVFISQFDGCTYVPGGQNCTCAAHAMWLFRASGGRIHATSCSVRRLTGDKIDGTHLGQMEQVSLQYGITTGRVYRPIAASTLVQIAATRRYGFHIQGSYKIMAGTPYDCFQGQFKGGHDWYVSGLGTRAATWRVADPGANGRRPGIPTGYQDIPISLMLEAAANLNVSQFSIKPLGVGKAYVYITPPDPAPIASQKFHAVVTVRTKLWNEETKRWVYSSALVKVGTPLIVRGATYYKGDGRVPCYPIDGTSPNYPGYYVPKAHVKLGTKA